MGDGEFCHPSMPSSEIWVPDARATPLRSWAGPIPQSLGFCSVGDTPPGFWVPVIKAGSLCPLGLWVVVASCFAHVTFAVLQNLWPVPAIPFSVTITVVVPVCLSWPWGTQHPIPISIKSPQPPWHLHMLGDLFYELNDFQSEVCLSQNNSPMCDGESRIDVEKMGKKASLFFITNAFNFFHIVFCIRFMALKRIPGMVLQCWFILEACDKVSLSKYLIEVVSFYPCQE